MECVEREGARGVSVPAKAAAVFVSAALVATLAPAALPQQAEAATSGTCGTCDWTLSSGTLTIESGTLDSFDSMSDVPWMSSSEDVTKVVIESTVKARDSVAYMFYWMPNLTSISGLGNLNVSNTENFEYMFYHCDSLSSIDVSSFDTSSATDMNRMFEYCESVESLDLASFDTSSVTDMTYMFFNCDSLKTLDLSSIDTGKTTSTAGMFTGDYALRTVKTGSDFAFVSSTGYLPTPKSGSTYGSWRNSSGTVYDEPEDIPSNKATTYTAVFGTVAKAKVTLSKSKFSYDGKAKKPSVTVKLNGSKLAKGDDYTVSYASGRKNVGSYKVTVKGTGEYYGTTTKTFKIVPAATKVKKAKAGKKKITVKLSKAKGASTYQVRYKVKGSKKWKTASSKKPSATLKKLKSGKKYQVQARAVKKVKGKQYASSWTKAKTVKVK